MKISEFLFTMENELTLKDLQDLVNKLSMSPFESFSLGYDFDIPVHGCREATDEDLELLRNQEKERELRKQNEKEEKQRIEKLLIEDMWLGVEDLNKTGEINSGKTEAN
jgi:hypothetical protein